MTDTPNLDDLLEPYSPRHTRGRPMSDERRAELARRRQAGTLTAYRALARLHPDDFAALLEQARARVEAESGELPA